MTTTEKPLRRLSPPAMRVALDVITGLKLRQEHASCDRDECEIARDRWTHCEHGTFVGDWAGPDYMCGWCEDGVSDYEYALGVAMNEQLRHVSEIRARMARAALDAMCDTDQKEWISSRDAAEMGRLMTSLAGRGNRYW